MMLLCFDMEFLCLFVGLMEKWNELFEDNEIYLVTDYRLVK